MDMLSDDYMLLSVVNTKLRDEFISLEELAAAEGAEAEEIRERLENIGYFYDRATNSFR